MKVNVKKTPLIKTSKQAAKEAEKMTPGASWYGRSPESHLMLRTLIYCAELLENMQRARGKKRQKSAWQSFLSREMKAGSSIQAAAAKWNGKKKG